MFLIKKIFLSSILLVSFNSEYQCIRAAETALQQTNCQAYRVLRENLNKIKVKLDNFMRYASKEPIQQFGGILTEFSLASRANEARSKICSPADYFLFELYVASCRIEHILTCDICLNFLTHICGRKNFTLGYDHVCSIFNLSFIGSIRLSTYYISSQFYNFVYEIQQHSSAKRQNLEYRISEECKLLTAQSRIEVSDELLKYFKKITRFGLCENPRCADCEDCKRCKERIFSTYYFGGNIADFVLFD